MKKHVLPLALLIVFLLSLSIFPAVAADGSAPIAKNLELNTYRGVAVGGCLSASDPDGGPFTYEITTSPIKGSIDLDEEGHFVYTPKNGKRGKDYFGYRATDADGNRSQEATVIIRIEKQKSKVTYSDLSGNGSAYAAVRLADDGLFIGECVAGYYVFSPDTPITREEFLTLCMKVTGHEVAAEDTGTGFGDEAEISAWAKPYVNEALHCGIISGYDEDDTVVFCPTQNISAAEAAVILDRAAVLTDAVAAWYSDGDAVPAWALQSAANVSSCGLLPSGSSFLNDTLSRAEAAELLSSAMDLLSNR